MPWILLRPRIPWIPWIPWTPWISWTIPFEIMKHEIEPVRKLAFYRRQWRGNEFCCLESIQDRLFLRKIPNILKISNIYEPFNISENLLNSAQVQENVFCPLKPTGKFHRQAKMEKETDRTQFVGASIIEKHAARSWKRVQDYPHDYSLSRVDGPF